MKLLVMSFCDRICSAFVVYAASVVFLSLGEFTAWGEIVLVSDRLQRLGPFSNTLVIDRVFVETTNGIRFLDVSIKVWERGKVEQREACLEDGTKVKIGVRPVKDGFVLKFVPVKGTRPVKWGIGIRACENEFFTGLMERTVDGPQQASWEPGISAAMDLRGQTVEMIVKPTTSVYAPFFISSRGYGLYVLGTWPGFYDFCSNDTERVNIVFEGPQFEAKFYVLGAPMQLVQAFAKEVGPPFLPPKWVYGAWRWRDEHRHRTTYYDGTPVTGPFNSEVMEDILMMRAFGIPCAVYWIDRPWAPGPLGYDDFEIDTNRLPNFSQMVRWLEEGGIRLVMWIGPFFQGQMASNALALGYTYPGQRPQRNNYPLVDFTNPEARSYWQSGVVKLLRMGVAGFKLDRGEEGIPDDGPYKVFDGRSIRELRNAYPVLYLKATYDIARKYRGKDFVCMPRAAYTGSTKYGVFWGGDVAGTPEGLRASIIALLRSAVMGYPNWGSDTCGYARALLDTELCMRWLSFSCFCPIMEVGPTRNVGFWNLPREPRYDTNVIAAWRLYARLHTRLMEYSYWCAKEAAKNGTPIARPLFLIEPETLASWTNWWTYLYGPDILVSPIWKLGKTNQEVYLPKGHTWVYAWDGKEYEGGQTVTVRAESHQIPIFVRKESGIILGDLNAEWEESFKVASQRPNLSILDAEVRSWFERFRRDE